MAPADAEIEWRTDINDTPGDRSEFTMASNFTLSIMREAIVGGATS